MITEGPKNVTKYYTPEWKKFRQERIEFIMELRKSGKTFSAIGKELGVSRQRVHQIINKTTKN